MVLKGRYDRRKEENHDRSLLCSDQSRQHTMTSIAAEQPHIITSTPDPLPTSPRQNLSPPYHLTPTSTIAQLSPTRPNSCTLPYQTHPGEVTLEDFIAFAEKKTWGQEESTDPFNALLAATANETLLSNAAAAEGAGRGETGAGHGDECSDSDTEDARCGPWDQLCRV